MERTTKQRSLFHRESARIFGAAALFVCALRTRNDATRRHDVCHDAVHKLRPTICIVTHLPRDTFPLFEAAFPTQCQWKKRGQNRPFYFCSPAFSFLPFSFPLFIPSLCRFSSFCLFHLLPLFLPRGMSRVSSSPATDSRIEVGNFYVSNYFADARIAAAQQRRIVNYQRFFGLFPDHVIINSARCPATLINFNVIRYVMYVLRAATSNSR